MIRTRKRLWLCISLLAANILFIWVNSLLPRELSAEFSRLVGSILNFLFPGPDIPASGQGHGLLRKVAHFTEFCSLGVLLGWLWGMLTHRSRFLLPAAAGFAVACVDETIQCFVPGRGPGILDVAIDTAGVLLGLAGLYLIYRYRKKRKQNP